VLHESFWVTVGAAAPVIALAAIVAIADTRAAEERYLDALEKVVMEAKQKNPAAARLDVLPDRSLPRRWTRRGAVPSMRLGPEPSISGCN
jgi:hypothetical protein